MRALREGPSAPMVPLRSAVARAAGWTLGINVGSRLLSLLRVAVLARLLAPDDFGAFSITLATLAAFEALTQSGFASALVQRPGAIASYLDTVWTIQILRGIVLGLFLYLLAPALALFFNEPRVTLALRLLAVVPVIQGFENSGIVLLQRKLQFDRQFVMSMGQIAADFLVSVIAAVSIGGVLALICGFAAGRLVSVTLSYVVSPYRPSFRLNRQHALELHRFGRWVTLNNLLQFVLLRLDNVVVGKILGAVALGAYDLAYRVSEVLTRSATSMISSVTFPAYSRVQSDQARLKRGYMSALELSASVGVPVAIALSLSAPAVIQLLLGDRWQSASPALAFLSLAGGIRSVTATAGPLFLAVGRPSLDFRMNVFRACGMYALMIPLLRAWGLKGAGIAVLVGTLLAVPPFLYYVRDAIGIRAIDFATAVTPALYLSGSVLTAWYLCRMVSSVNSSWSLIGVPACMGVAYLLCGLLLWILMERGPVRAALLLLQKKQGRDSF